MSEETDLETELISFSLLMLEEKTCLHPFNNKRNKLNSVIVFFLVFKVQSSGYKLRIRSLEQSGNLINSTFDRLNTFSC